jgi:plastocyanin
VRKFWALATALGVILAAWPPAFAYEAVEVKDGGSIEGTIKYEGTAPAREKPKATKDKAVCGKADLSEDLIVGSDKGIANVVVMLANVERGKKWPAAKPTLEQKDCDFQPHVLVIPTGVEVDIKNDDGIGHNVHTFSTKNPSLNRNQPKFRKVMTAKFDKAEIIKVICDVHDWMLAWFVVSDDPYVAVTDGQGHFEIKGVPAGSYKVEIWHEKLGKETKDVTVGAGETVALNLNLKGR